MSEPLDWNAKTIAEFRANEGRVGGVFEGAPLVLLHHRGRKSGREHVTPMMYLAHDTEPDIIYVFATKAGAPTNPDWYHNLTAAGDGSIERGTKTYTVTIRELTGAERDRIYAEQARRYPGFAEYCTPNGWNPHHSCARTQAGVAEPGWARHRQVEGCPRRGLARSRYLLGPRSTFPARMERGLADGFGKGAGQTGCAMILKCGKICSN